MIKPTKIIITACLISAAMAIATSTAYAFFVESATDTTSGIVGNVELDSNGITISNMNNFNPGDENPESALPEGHRAGTDHKISFTMTNNGSKSVATRNVIDVSLKSLEGNVLDPSVITLYQTDATGNTTDIPLENATDTNINPNINGTLGERYYILSDGTVTADKPSDLSSIQGLRYIVLGPTLNGVGEAAEIETTSSGSTASVNYAVALDYDTPNMYQGATIEFDVTSQCIQFRNTNRSDWKTMFTDHISGQVA